MRRHRTKHLATKCANRHLGVGTAPARLCSLLLAIALTAMLPARAQEEKSADHGGYAWAVLDSAWRMGGSLQRGAVLGSLTLVESARATEVYSDAIERGEPFVAARAAELASERRMSDLLPPIGRRLRTESDENALISLVGSLRKAHSPAAASLAEPFAMVDREPLTGVAFGALSELGKSAVPALAAIARGGCGRCRDTALRVLVRLGPSRSEGIDLDSVLRDSDRHVRVLGAIVLAGRKQVVDSSILELGLSEPDLFLRVWSALALYHRGDTRYRGVLLDDMGAADPEQRYLAIREIVRLADPPLRDIALGIALKDVSPTVRSAVFDTPTEERYWPMVRNLLGDPDPAIRLLAAERIAAAPDRIGPDAATRDRILRDAFSLGTPVDQQRVLDLLARSGAITSAGREMAESAASSQWISVRAAAVGVLKKDGERAVPWIVPLLDSPETAISASAASALVDMSPAEAEDALWATLHSAKSEQVKIICAGYLIRALEVLAR